MIKLEVSNFLMQKEIFDSEDVLVFSHPIKGDWGVYTAGKRYDEIIHVCLKKDKKVWREMIKVKKTETA